MAPGEKRKTGDGGAADRVPPLHPDESHLPPSRAAFRLSADTGCTRAFDLRAQRGRKSVCIVLRQPYRKTSARGDDDGINNGSEKNGSTECGAACRVDRSACGA